MAEQPDGPGPESGEAEKRGVGRPAVNIDQRQRDEILTKLENGRGLDKALRELGLSYRAYRNAVRDDPDFRQEVESARRAADQTLEEYGYFKAMAEFADPDLLNLIWSRRDKARYLNLARADRAKERAEERLERDKDRALKLHLAEMAAAAREKERAERGGGKDEPDEPLPLERFTPQQLAEWRDLNRILLGDDANPPA